MEPVAGSHPLMPRIQIVGLDPRYGGAASKWPTIDAMQPWLDAEEEDKSSAADEGEARRLCRKSHICSGLKHKCKIGPCKVATERFCWTCDFVHYASTIFGQGINAPDNSSSTL